MKRYRRMVLGLLGASCAAWLAVGCSSSEGTSGTPDGDAGTTSGGSATANGGQPTGGASNGGTSNAGTTGLAGAFALGGSAGAGGSGGSAGAGGSGGSAMAGATALGGATSGGGGGTATGGITDGGGGGTAMGGTASGGNGGKGQGGAANGGSGGKGQGGAANGGAGGKGQGGAANGGAGGKGQGGAANGGSGGVAGCVPDYQCKPTAPNTGDPEADCVARVNQFRACVCKPPLAADPGGDACSDQEAQYDADHNSAHAGIGAKICKPAFFAENECPAWPSVQSTIDGCSQQMFNEGPPPTATCTGACYQAHGHFINMTGNYKSVSCGFFTTAAGKVWTVQNFR